MKTMYVNFTDKKMSCSLALVKCPIFFLDQLNKSFKFVILILR